MSTRILVVLLLGVLVSFKISSADEAASSNSAADPNELAHQWEQYANKLTDELQKQKVASDSLKNALESSKFQLQESEKLVKEKDDRITKLKKSLEILEEKVKTLSSALEEEEKKALKLAPLPGEVESLKKTVGQNEKKLVETQAKLKDTKIALEYATKALGAAEKELAEKSKELSQVHANLLPVWLVKSLELYLKRAEHSWEIRWKPLLLEAQRKISWGIAKGQECWNKEVHPHLAPHLEKAKIFSAPHLRKLSTFLKEAKLGVQEKVVPAVASLLDKAKPHLQKAKEAVEEASEKYPWLKKVLFSLEKGLKSLKDFHFEVKVVIKTLLFQHFQVRNVTENFISLLAIYAILIPALVSLYIGWSILGFSGSSAKSPQKDVVKKHKKKVKREA